MLDQPRRAGPVGELEPPPKALVRQRAGWRGAACPQVNERPGLFEPRPGGFEHRHGVGVTSALHALAAGARPAWPWPGLPRCGRRSGHRNAAGSCSAAVTPRPVNLPLSTRCREDDTMSEERQRQRMTEWASLFLEPGETIRVVTPGTFCDSAAGSPCADAATVTTPAAGPPAQRPSITGAKTYTRGESHEQPSRRDGRTRPGDHPGTAFGMAPRVRNAIRVRCPGLAAVAAGAPLCRPGRGPHHRGPRPPLGENGANQSPGDA